MNLGPFDRAREARTELATNGYMLSSVKKGPDKWVHKASGKEKAIRKRLDGEGFVIVPYPRRLTTKMKVRHYD